VVDLAVGLRDRASSAPYDAAGLLRHQRDRGLAAARGIFREAVYSGDIRGAPLWRNRLREAHRRQPHRGARILLDVTLAQTDRLRGFSRAAQARKQAQALFETPLTPFRVTRCDFGGVEATPRV
jgi:hypothetical protein